MMTKVLSTDQSGLALTLPLLNLELFLKYFFGLFFVLTQRFLMSK